MNRRGTTLVELMIVVAMLTIMTTALGTASRRARLLGLAEVQQQQAQVLLEYRAERLLAEQPARPETLARLTESLPEATVSELREGATITLSVSWRDALGGPSTRSLTVFAR